jgi:hypothetical protein
MGLSGGSDLVYTSSKLSLSEIAAIARHRNESHGKQFLPCVDLDANLLACNINSKDKIKAMISMAINFAKEGLDVGIVVDGPVRDDSKRVSTKRQGNRERVRFRALFTKAQQQQLRSQINDPPENFKLKEAKEELKKLEGIAKKNESAARNPLPPNFMSHLREAISHEQSKREESGDESIGEISLHISMFQADTVICYRLVNGLSHLAVTTDSTVESQYHKQSSHQRQQPMRSQHHNQNSHPRQHHCRKQNICPRHHPVMNTCRQTRCESRPKLSSAPLLKHYVAPMSNPSLP